MTDTTAGALKRRPAGSSTREFAAGARLLGRGFGIFLRSPRMLLLGLVPALISLVLVVIAFGLLLYFVGDLAALVTWFADDWSPDSRNAARIVAGVAIVGAGLLTLALTYTAVTLIIGDPFYEVISKQVEDAVGGAPAEADLPWYVTLWWNLVDSIRLVLLSMIVTVPLFVAGFVPVIGQTVVPVLGVVAGGWLLGLELTGVPFNRRGLRLADRRRILRANRALTLGFGVPVFLMLMVPFAALLVVPVAVAGATLLTREVLGLPTTPVRPAAAGKPAGGIPAYPA